MPIFNPNKPQNGEDADADVLRDNFNALNDHSTSLETIIANLSGFIVSQAAINASLQAQIDALTPHESVGFGDARACGALTYRGMLQGKPYFQMAGGAWLFWSTFDGQWAIKFDQPDENSSCGEYFRADPNMNGPYVNRSATDPAGTVS